MPDEARANEPLTQPKPPPSPSPTAPGVEVLESFDNLAPLRNALREVAEKRSEWAGIPMPLEGEKLVLSPRHPYAGLFPTTEEPNKLPDGTKLRNVFYSHRSRMEVVVFEENGKVRWGWLPAYHHLLHDLHTMGCSAVWGLEQEHRALILLGTLIKHSQLKQYLLTGMFMETSQRSKLTYVFRKLKPTVVLKAEKDDEDCKILCTLCLHPLGYYAGSWAGAMCPTDDVIAHLMLMRADEHMFWKSANQHPPHRPEAGL